MDNNSKDTFVFYKDWLDAIDSLAKESQLQMYRAIARYAIYGEIPKEEKVLIIFKFLKGTIDRDQEKYASTRANRSEAGKRHTGNQYTRAKEKMEQMEQVSQNGTDGTSGTDNVNVDVNDKKVVSAHERIDFQGIVDEYNAAALTFGFHIVKKLDQSRKDKIKRLLDDYERKDITDALAIASKSKFLRGGGSRGWSMNFAFFVNKTNFLNILEGAYNDKDGAAESKSDATHIRNTDEKEWGL